MGQTAIYKLRWPERVAVAADGPNGYRDLASDVEDQMIRFRTRNTYDGWLDTPVTINPGATKTLYSYLVTPTVRGWVIVEYQVNIIGWQGGIFAGFVRGYIGPEGGTLIQARTQRYHNEIAGTMWYTTGRMAYQTLDLAPIRFRLDLSADAGSSNYVRVPFLPFAFQQYGGKLVGAAKPWNQLSGPWTGLTGTWNGL